MRKRLPLLVLLAGCGAAPDPRAPQPASAASAAPGPAAGEPSAMPAGTFVAMPTVPSAPSAPSAAPAPRASSQPRKQGPARLSCGQARLRTMFGPGDPGAAANSPFLGMWSPAEPAHPRVNSHVRRELAAPQGTPAARAIDEAKLDTYPCQKLETGHRDVTVEVQLGQSGVASVERQEEGSELLQCVMRAFCEVSLPASATGKATVKLRLRPITERPKIEVMAGNPEGPQATLIEVVSEAAAACEQGQRLGPRPVSSVVTVSASGHTSVAPTVNLEFREKNEMNQCIIERIGDFRLPLSPWTSVGELKLRIVWEG